MEMPCHGEPFEWATLRERDKFADQLLADARYQIAMDPHILGVEYFACVEIVENCRKLIKEGDAYEAVFDRG